TLRFELTLLGTSAALPTANRFASAALLRSEKTSVLLDCGEGTQIRLQQAGLGLGKCAHILLTHLHGDHYFGLPGLLSSLALNGRTKPLTIVSPEPIEPRLRVLFEGAHFPFPFELRFVVIAATEPTRLEDSGELEVTAFPLRHRVPTNGYLLREKARQGNIRKEKLAEYAIPWQAIAAIKTGGDFTQPNGTVVPHEELVTEALPSRAYAHCSDTLYFPELAEYIRGVDLVYHEATFLHDLLEDAIQKGHATALQAGMVARDAGAKTLVLGHFSTRYADGRAHEAEAKTVFANTYAGEDLWRFAVPFSRRTVVAS
ncbi:MAG: ribonuclease Z, partial [Bacteroidota bacterium]